MSVQYKGKTRKVKKLKDGGFHLNLSKKKITDISQIKGLDQLTDLTGLNLSYNKISEIKGLESLNNLKSLYIESNQIYEIKGLDNLKNLSRLSLMDNNISELKGLQNIENLKSLSIHGNPLDNWMRKNFGRGPYGQGVVEYCRKMVEGENYDCSRVEGLLDHTKEEIENIIKSTPANLWLKELTKIYDTIMGLLEDIYGEVYDRTLFYDFFGKLLTRNPEFFDTRFSDTYNSKVAGWESQKLEMESYILEKYCFFEGEFFISKFYGGLYHTKGFSAGYRLNGRLYATNYRIIGHGAYIRYKSGITDYLRKNIPNLARFSYSTSKAIFEDIQKFSGKDEKYKALPIFGYHYPILNAKSVNLNLKKRYLSLYSKPSSYRISITRSNFETTAGFIEMSHAILTPIYNYLMENQKWRKNR